MGKVKERTAKAKERRAKTEKAGTFEAKTRVSEKQLHFKFGSNCHPRLFC